MFHVFVLGLDRGTFGKQSFHRICSNFHNLVKRKDSKQWAVCQHFVKFNVSQFKVFKLDINDTSIDFFPEECIISTIDETFLIHFLKFMFFVLEKCG